MHSEYRSALNAKRSEGANQKQHKHACNGDCGGEKIARPGGRKCRPTRSQWLPFQVDVLLSALVLSWIVGAIPRFDALKRPVFTRVAASRLPDLW
jgi:hypothetical protein